jgi:hypothetical protein
MPPTSASSIVSIKTGELFLFHTRLREGIALRIAIGHLQTTERHARRGWELLTDHVDS